MFKGMKMASITLAAALLASTSANAATVVVSNLSASWINTVGGGGTVTTSGSDPARLRWGTPQSSDGKSGYDFDSVEGNVTYTVNPPPETAAQAIGTFTHLNNPISAGTSITSTTLQISASISVDGGAAINKIFLFNFTHDETTNTGGGNCCPDIVTFASNNASQTFSVAGVDYTLILTGFKTSPNGPILTSFSSPEGGDNDATLYAKIAASTPAVPEPATWGMMIGGLGLAGMAMRRRSTKVSFA